MVGGATVSDGLIYEIQRDALISNTSVSSLLRKIKLAAAKLKIPKIEEWVEHELTGYRQGQGEVPDYRIASGRVKAWNPIRGWIPVGGNAEVMDVLSEVKLVESIASLESALAQNTDGSFHLAFSPTKMEVFNEMFGCNTPRAGVDVPTGVVAHAIETVRNLVLDWAIAMEKAGVCGDGLSFTADEREKAQSASAVFHIGSIGTVVGNFGVGNTAGDITNAPLDIEQVKNLISQVKSHAHGLTNEGVDGAELSAAIKSLEEAIAAKKPGLIRAGLNELQKVVAKAAGGLLAHGVLGLLHTILATGVPNV
jgi:hypothetical protein